MAVTQLADIYSALVFDPGVQEAATELNVFAQSGVIQNSAMLDAMANGPGSIGEIPFFLGLNNNEPNYSSDNPASLAVADKVTTAKQVYRTAFMNKSYSNMDLAREIGLIDPLQAIVQRIGQYWATVHENRLINSALGLLNDNIANGFVTAGDMVNVIGTDAAGAPVAAELISPDAVITAKQTMGDHAENLTAIAMHSVVYSELQRQDQITFIRASDSNIVFPTYLGYRVIVSDQLPAVAGAQRIMYTTILFANGAFAGGNGMPIVPSETIRVPGAGDGGGQETLTTRSTRIIHPIGFEFTSTTVTGATPNYAELALAVNWNPVYADRKNVGIAFLNSNG